MIELSLPFVFENKSKFIAKAVNINVAVVDTVVCNHNFILSASTDDIQMTANEIVNDVNIFLITDNIINDFGFID